MEMLTISENKAGAKTARSYQYFQNMKEE